MTLLLREIIALGRGDLGSINASLRSELPVPATFITVVHCVVLTASLVVPEAEVVAVVLTGGGGAGEGMPGEPVRAALITILLLVLMVAGGSGTITARRFFPAVVTGTTLFAGVLPVVGVAPEVRVLVTPLILSRICFSQTGLTTSGLGHVREGQLNWRRYKRNLGFFFQIIILYKRLSEKIVTKNLTLTKNAYSKR